MTEPVYDHTDAAKTRLIVIERPEQTVAGSERALAAILKYLETIPRPSNAELNRAGDVLRESDPHTRVGY